MEKTTSSVVEVVDGTVDTTKLPPLPVVEPVVEEVKDIVENTMTTSSPKKKGKKSVTPPDTVLSEVDTVKDTHFESDSDTKAPVESQSASMV